MLLRQRGQARHFQECGIEVGTHRGCLDHAPGRQRTRPLDDQWRSDSALVEPSFSGAQRKVRRGLVEAPAHQRAEPSVVGYEHDRRAIVDAEFGELVQDPTHALVRALDHRRVGCVILPQLRNRLSFGLEMLLPLGAESGRLPFEARRRFRLGLERRVHGVVGQHEEKRLGAIPLEEVERRIRQSVCEVGALRVAFEVGHVGRGEVRIFVGREVRARLPGVIHREVEVETLGIR